MKSKDIVRNRSKTKSIWTPQGEILPPVQVNIYALNLQTISCKSVKYFGWYGCKDAHCPPQWRDQRCSVCRILVDRGCRFHLEQSRLCQKCIQEHKLQQRTQSLIHTEAKTSFVVLPKGHFCYKVEEVFDVGALGLKELFVCSSLTTHVNISIISFNNNCAGLSIWAGFAHCYDWSACKTLSDNHMVQEQAHWVRNYFWIPHIWCVAVAHMIPLGKGGLHWHICFVHSINGHKNWRSEGNSKWWIK